VTGEDWWEWTVYNESKLENFDPICVGPSLIGTSWVGTGGSRGRTDPVFFSISQNSQKNSQCSGTSTQRCLHPLTPLPPCSSVAAAIQCNQQRRAASMQRRLHPTAPPCSAANNAAAPPCNVTSTQRCLHATPGREGASR
jgi:hypothetical protein